MLFLVAPGRQLDPTVRHFQPHRAGRTNCLADGTVTTSIVQFRRSCSIYFSISPRHTLARLAETTCNQLTATRTASREYLSAAACSTAQPPIRSQARKSEKFLQTERSLHRCTSQSQCGRAGWGWYHSSDNRPVSGAATSEKARMQPIALC